MKYDAVTFDTQVVEKEGFRFDSGLLDKLKQFQKGPVSVVVSHIVATEISNHLVEKTRSTKEELERAHRKAVDFGILPPAHPLFHGADFDAGQLAKERFLRFLKDIGAKTIPVNTISVSDLLKCYFSSSPPFSATGQKKSEFPDAAALLSLEGWAETEDKILLAISRDKDWMSYGGISQRIDVVDDLADGLRLLQEDAEEATTIIGRLLVDIDADRSTDLARKFGRRIESEVSGAYVSGEADSPFFAEPDHVELTCQDYKFVPENSPRFTLVEVGRHRLAFRVALELSLHADTSFSLSVHDSIDDDYVSMGSANAHIDLEVQCSALVALEGDFTEGDIDIVELEVIDLPDSVDFGYVEPDWDEPDWDEFEYPEEPPEEKRD